jgi:hypothetical protein
MFRAFQSTETSAVSVEFTNLAGDITESLLGDGDNGVNPSTQHISDMYVKKVPQINPMKTTLETNRNHRATVPHWSWAGSYDVVLESQDIVTVNIKHVGGKSRKSRLYTAVINGTAISVSRCPLKGHDGVFGIEIGWNGNYVQQKVPEYNGFGRGYTVRMHTKLERTIPSTRNVVFPGNYQMIKVGSKSFAVDFDYPTSEFSTPLTHDAAFVIATTMFHDNE